MRRLRVRCRPRLRLQQRRLLAQPGRPQKTMVCPTGELCLLLGAV